MKTYRKRSQICEVVEETIGDANQIRELKIESEQPVKKTSKMEIKRSKLVKKLMAIFFQALWEI